MASIAEELLRLICKQAKGDELTADERKQFKYMRARYKHLRFLQRLYLKKHQAGFLFGKMMRRAINALYLVR